MLFVLPYARTHLKHAKYTYVANSLTILLSFGGRFNDDLTVEWTIAYENLTQP